MHYLLFYDYVPDVLERRGPFRPAHFALARAAVARGELVLGALDLDCGDGCGGTFADPVDGAVLLFKADSPAVAEEFAKADPYVLNGLVTNWKVRTWTTAVGENAAVQVSI